MPNYSVHTLQLDENATSQRNQFFIRIDSGPADGLEFIFGEIKMLDEEGEDGSGKLQFEYQPLSVIDGLDKETMEVEIADVLQQILEEMVARDTDPTEELDEDDRNPDSNEST